MLRVLQNFADHLSIARGDSDFSEAMAVTAAALDLQCFAYLALPRRRSGKPHIISTYPVAWTSHYLHSRYERLDPIIVRALGSPEPFRWGAGLPMPITPAQQAFLDEASQFGIKFGFTVPIHDNQGPVAALTFAVDEVRPQFDRCITSNALVLQTMAFFFHAHLRRTLPSDRNLESVSLSPRECECLEWASQGKSAWEIGLILGISRNTAAYYLNNAKQKLGVRTVVQAAMRFAAAKKRRPN
ncbi:LuxR family transcriptional regulator [Bradyrhizobium tropiciagri]|uniref:LuxR family transcriptional regulator n=1 Tax=Bradyrhizobium tropiciagri TaxID=312253 RepID=UPI00067E0E5F|nr:LuxR family transcriptional regulator [Bradyrhizobium tropiciagri]